MQALVEPDEDVCEQVDSTTVDPDGRKDETIKTGWPELQKDMAPSGLCIPAGRCIQRHIKKVGDLLKRFGILDAEHLSDLQKGSWS